MPLNSSLPRLEPMVVILAQTDVHSVAKCKVKAIGAFSMALKLSKNINKETVILENYP